MCIYRCTYPTHLVKEGAVVEVSAAALQTETQLCQHLGRIHNNVESPEVPVTSVILELYMMQCLDTHTALVPDQIPYGPVQWETLKLLGDHVSKLVNSKFCSTEYH